METRAWMKEYRDFCTHFIPRTHRREGSEPVILQWLYSSFHRVARPGWVTPRIRYKSFGSITLTATPFCAWELSMQCSQPRRHWILNQKDRWALLILIRLSPQVTNGLSKSPVLPSFQIQQCILILILFNISTAADTVDPSFHETPFALLSGPPPHMLCFPPPSLALPSLLCWVLLFFLILYAGMPHSSIPGFLFPCVISSNPMASKAAYILITPTFYLQIQHFHYSKSQTQRVQNGTPNCFP